MCEPLKRYPPLDKDPYIKELITLFCETDAKLRKEHERANMWMNQYTTMLNYSTKLAEQLPKSVTDKIIDELNQEEVCQVKPT